MRVRLSFYYKGHRPGDVIDVSADEATRLERDGYLAERMPDRPEAKKAEPANKKDAPETK